jgi:hypothetical protein
MAENKDIQRILRKLKLVHTAMLTGLLIFLAIVIYLVSFGNVSLHGSASREMGEILLLVMACLVIAEFFVGRIIIQRRIREINTDLPLHQKLTLTEPIFIIIWGLIEGIGLFSIIILLLSGIIWITVISALLIIVFLYFQPSVARISSILRLTQHETDQLYSV